MENQELLQTMSALDSQLTILNIEGFQSECCIYEWEETEETEFECPTCNGQCQVEWYEGTGYYFRTDDCPNCGGSGTLCEEKVVQLKEVEIESNIFI